MFSNKKIIYIFASFGDENLNPFKIEESPSFLKKIFHRPQKKKEQTFKPNEQTYQISENFINSVTKYTEKKCFSFYLNKEESHDQFIEDIQKTNADRFYIFPLFPQYRKDISQIANFFYMYLNEEITNKFFWIKSYSQNLLFIKAIQRNIKTILKKNNLDQKNTLFLFMARKCPDLNALYSFECEITCQNIIKAFQFVEGNLHYFAKDTIDDLKNLKLNIRKNIVITPITTLIDDSITLSYLELTKSFLEKEKKDVFICKTLNYNSYFIRSILDIIDEKNFVSNEMLVSF